MRFKCANLISIFLPLMPLPLEALGAGQRPGNVSSMLMVIARDLA